MLHLNEYKVLIFDCDGVIFDSNQLKIKAMKNTLMTHFSDQNMIENCLEYFRNNFGKSRFHHIAHFLEKILMITSEEKSDIEHMILEDYSKKCRKLYLSAKLTPNFISFLEQCDGRKYVASGSDQDELIDVFYQRNLDKLFNGIFGSPTPKADIIKKILEQNKNKNAIMFGDSESDMLAAHVNKIDFVFYSPFSNVKEKMLKKCKEYHFPVMDDFSSLKL